MAETKLIVIYPFPKDVDAFERVYTNEHVPLAVAKLVGKTSIVATKVLGSPQGTPPFYRIAEIYFPSTRTLEVCAASEGGKEALAHCREDFFGWTADFLGSRGRELHLRCESLAQDSKRSTLISSAIHMQALATHPALTTHFTTPVSSRLQGWPPTFQLATVVSAFC